MIISFNAHEVTDTSVTFTSFSNNFIAKDIALKNSYNHEVEGSKSGVSPALAVRVYGDKSAFYRCGFICYQDTLWDVRGRHYFKSCFIEGAIDFIWGSGQSIYEDAKISILSNGFITAQGRNSTKDLGGFVFIRGSVGGMNAQTYLGRAYGPYSRVIFYGTKFDDVISPQGWNAWHFSGHEGNFTFAEVSCSGPGADITKRVPWIKKFSSAEILQYSVATFIDIDGWIALQP
ncbi:hypothetical protein Nepgr_012264 [Nepenthes gracilis]|uniref:pectinesterase n=1 Tax=Nepenthes gracilis TaxID=150966 RepID=A0AAD3XMW8_NEPGR|nr:hypothetical protein Nepgr_012264 [Nepenthes gracilis]